MKAGVGLAWVVQLVWDMDMVTLAQTGVPMLRSLQPRSSQLHLQKHSSHLFTSSTCAYGAWPRAGLLFWSLAEEWGSPNLKWAWQCTRGLAGVPLTHKCLWLQ